MNKKKIISIIISFVLVVVFIIIFINYMTNSWKRNFEISNIYIERTGELNPSYYINGAIKNKTNKDITLLIDVELKSGSKIKHKTCKMSLDSKETKNMDCLISDEDDIDGTYIPTIKNIEYHKKN